VRKYWHVIGIGVQNNLTYRFNFLARTLFGFIPLTAILLLWRNIYAAKGDGGLVVTFTLAQMIGRSPPTSRTATSASSCSSLWIICGSGFVCISPGAGRI
jgi:ABC-type uncharacterized transport system permease subunit